MKTKTIILGYLLLTLSISLKAQVKIGDNPGTINAASLLEMETTTKGVLLPRLTATERDAISSPPTGLWVFNTTANMPQYYDGANWTTVADQKAFGSITFTGNATTTTFPSTSTYVIVAATYAFGLSSNDFEMTTNGQLKYIGTRTKHFHIVCNISVSAGANNQVTGSSLALNGTPSGIRIERKIGTQDDLGAFSVHADYMLSTGDYISFMVYNETSTTAITVKHLYLFAMSMN